MDISAEVGVVWWWWGEREERATRAEGGVHGKVYPRISNAWESEEGRGSEIYPLWVSATDSTLFRRQCITEEAS
jgi:hypothetical protein